MDPHSPLRLDASTWSRRLGLLAASACDADPTQEAALLRDALALIGLAPSIHAMRLQGMPSAERFERLLAVNACESAVLALVPRDAVYLLSRGADGVSMASVVLDGDDAEVAADGATPGLALLAALAGALQRAIPASPAFPELGASVHPVRSAILH